jgi:hypothetical protein
MRGVPQRVRPIRHRCCPCACALPPTLRAPSTRPGVHKLRPRTDPDVAESADCRRLGRKSLATVSD